MGDGSDCERFGVGPYRWYGIQFQYLFTSRSYNNNEKILPGERPITAALESIFFFFLILKYFLKYNSLELYDSSQVYNELQIQYRALLASIKLVKYIFLSLPPTMKLSVLLQFLQLLRVIIITFIIHFTPTRGFSEMLGAAQPHRPAATATGSPPEWVESQNLTAWMTPLDLCLLANSSTAPIEDIMAGCEARVRTQGAAAAPLLPTRCRAGNSWPSKGGFCAPKVGCRVVFGRGRRGALISKSTPHIGHSVRKARQLPPRGQGIR